MRCFKSIGSSHKTHQLQLLTHLNLEDLYEKYVKESNKVEREEIKSHIEMIQCGFLQVIWVTHVHVLSVTLEEPFIPPR